MIQLANVFRKDSTKMTISKFKLKHYSLIKNIILCIVSSTALAMDFQRPDMSGILDYSSPVLNVLHNLSASMNGKGLIISLLFVSLFALVCYSEKTLNGISGKNLLLKFCSVLLAIVWLFSKSYSINNTSAAVFSGLDQLFKSLLFLIGSAYTIYNLFCLFDFIISPGAAFNSEFYASPVKCFIVSFIILLVSGAVNLICAYPGYISQDAWIQLAECADLVPFSSHAPPVHTLSIWFFVSVGRAFGNANAGMFLLIFTQYLLYAFSFSFMNYAATKIHAPRWIIICTVILAVFCPLFNVPYVLVSKDIPYTYAFVILLSVLVLMLEQKTEFFNSAVNCILFILSALGIMLFRKNGIYVFYPLCVGIFLYFVFRVKCGDIKFKLRLTAMLLCPVIAAAAINICIENRYVERKGSIAEALSLPIQQISRCIRDHDDLSPEDREVISRTILCDGIDERYNPIISDPVKNYFNADASAKDLSDFASVWLHCLMKHPVTCIDATFNQNYFLLNPFESAGGLYYEEPAEKHQWIAPHFGLTDEGTNNYLRLLSHEYESFMSNFPVISLFNNFSLYHIILLLLFFMAIRDRLWLLVVAQLPVIINLGTVILGPVVKNNARYVLPHVYTLPLYLAFYIVLKNREPVKNSKEN